MREGDDDTATAGADGVSERNGTTKGIGLRRVEAEDLVVGQRDGGESFVDLNAGNVRDRESGALEGNGNGLCRRGAEIDRSTGCVGKSCVCRFLSGEASGQGCEGSE